MKRFSSILFTLLAIAILCSCSKSEVTEQEAQSNKAERNFIREGNKLFADENYADAEVAYSKALQANPSSAIAAYNMGLALAKQANEGDTTGLLQRADSLFNFAASISNDKDLKSHAFYNKGNLAYGAQQYDRAIEDYKNALRCVPTDDDARYNLRMAQLKLQEQQQQQQDKNNDKNQDQNQDQQNQQNQQNQQDQNQNQNQDQQDKQDQSKQEQDNSQQQQQDKAQQQQGQPINMDERSVGQVLKAMQDKEKETQQKIYKMGEQQRQRERQATRNKW